MFTIIAYGTDYSWISNIENTAMTYLLKIGIEVIVFWLITRRVIAWAKTLE